jgi:phospholipase/carboxylesterase
MPATSQTTQFGELKCHIVDRLEGNSPRLLVVFAHGFGAPGTDLVSLAEPLLDASPVIAGAVRFVFPEAPMDLAPLGMPGGRAWWPINMAELASMHETNDYKQLTEVEPDGLQAASSQLAEAVKAMLNESGLEEGELFLGGFSQGAMASTDVVLRHVLRPAQLILMSGTLLCRADWERMAGEHAGCPVIQTHGTTDMVLPIEPSTWLRDILSENGFEVDYTSFMGPHTVPTEAFQKTATALMAKLVQSDD